MSVSLPSVPELNKQEARMMERDLLGVYVSDHPLREVGRMLRSSTNTQAVDLPEKKDRESVMVGGIITQFIQRMTKKGDPMAKVLTTKVDLAAILSRLK